MQAIDDAKRPGWQASFSTRRSPSQVLDAAEAYLHGAGVVATRLIGDVERRGDRVVARHGRVETNVQASATSDGAQVDIHRHGTAPLQNTRRSLYALGLIGTLIAWGLAWFNQRAGNISPLVLVAFFFAALLSAVLVLYVVDRSLEVRSQGLVHGLEDAIRGDPLLVLQREVNALERTSAVVNGMLFYCIALIIEFIVFATLLSDGIRDAIDAATTLEVMRWGFGLPIVPAVLFAVAYFFIANGIHRTRMGLVERRIGHT